MSVTNKAEYAVLIMVDLALHRFTGGVTAASDLADRRNLPLSVVPHLISALRRAGLVETARGPGGGVALAPAVDPRLVSVARILNAVGENVVIKNCSGAGRTCERREGCLLLGTWRRAQTAVDRVLHSVTLAHLVDLERAAALEER